MQDLLQQLLDHLRGLSRFKVWALLTTWIVCLVGWLVVLSLPPVYEASSRVYVDTSAILKPLLEGIAVEQNVNSQLSYVKQALLSRPQLEAVIRETDMDIDADSPQQREYLVTALRENVKIESVTQGEQREGKGDSLFTISYQSDSRKQSLAVVQSLVNSFVDNSLGGKRAGSESAQRFLQAQVQEYEKRLATAEAALADFKKKNIGLVPGAQGDYFTRLQTETDGIDKAQASLRVALERRQALDRQLKGESPRIAGGQSGSSLASPSGASADVNARIAETQSRLDDLLLKYTEKHPDVIATRETLRELQARRAAEIEAFKRGTATPDTLAGLSANPVYQQIQLQINEVDVEIASLRSELGVHQQRVGELKGMLDVAPGVEADYSRLMRDYDVTKAQYNELVSRLDRAHISDQAEQTGTVKFEVIDPPTVLLEPVAPNRPRLLTMVLLAGLAAGLGLTYLLNQLRPVFDNVRSLRDVTGLPVLGAVSRTWRERYHAEQKAELMRIAAATACLFAVFVLILLVYRPAANAVQSIIGT